MHYIIILSYAVLAVLTFALVMYLGVKIGLAVHFWYEACCQRREFWKLFDCWHLAMEPDWRKKIGLEVIKKITTQKKSVRILRESMDDLKSKRVFTRDTSELDFEISEIEGRLVIVEMHYQRACFLADFMGYKQEVLMVKRGS